MAVNANCLNKYDSALFDNLYASVPVLLYITSMLTSVSSITAAQITLSPFVLFNKACIFQFEISDFRFLIYGLLFLVFGFPETSNL